MDAKHTTLLRQGDVCKMLGISKPTISRWLKEGRVGLPLPRFIGSRRYWSQDEIEAFLASRPVGPTAAEAIAPTTTPAAAE